MKYRIEKDTIGEVKVPNNAYWGAQTERSRLNFKIGKESSMPIEIIYGYAYLKKAAAYTNYDLGILDIKKRDLPKETTGVVITEILRGSLLTMVSVNDIIVELQKKRIKDVNQFNNLIKEVINKGAQTLYLAIYNSSNQRSYITVKLK